MHFVNIGMIQLIAQLPLKTPQHNLWQYDDKAKMKCLQKNYDMKASAFCGKYECKLEVIGK